MDNSHYPATKCHTRFRHSIELKSGCRSRSRVPVATNVDKPKFNVKFGIAYLVTRMAKFEPGSIPIRREKRCQECSVEKLLDDVNDHDVVSQCDQE